MLNSDNRLFCRLNGLSWAVREQQRIVAMAELGLLELERIPVFEEATQTAARLLNLPICLFSLMEQTVQQLKSAVGLSRLGLMNDLSTQRQFPRLESFCTYVVDSQQVLAINDTLTHPAFANTILVHQYGIRAYLGVPLMTSGGYCVGTLAVMDSVPHRFTPRDIECLELTARWSMSEFERQQTHQEPSFSPPLVPLLGTPVIPIAHQLRVELLTHLTQELRTPLTSVLGMASVLNREIYGPLTHKQKEYLDIIHQSGRYLLSLVNEILELSALKSGEQALNLVSVDIEMLCQQVINTLEQAADRHDQQIRLSVEPGRRIWQLDKEKVRQMLYHLVLNIIQSANAGSTVRLHVSRKESTLSIAIWISHPWLGEGLPYRNTPPKPSLVSMTLGGDGYDSYYLSDVEVDTLSQQKFIPEISESILHDGSNLGVLLCRQYAEAHQGQLTLQRVSETSYRYIIHLPHLAHAQSPSTQPVF